MLRKLRNYFFIIFLLFTGIASTLAQCWPNSTQSDYHFIRRLMVGEIYSVDNSANIVDYFTENYAGSYFNNTNQIAEVYQGQVFHILTDPRMTWYNSVDGWTFIGNHTFDAWIDWNDNNVFEASELINLTDEGIAPPFVDEILLEDDAPLGDHKLRVKYYKEDITGTLDPCGASDNNTTIDVTLRVLSKRGSNPLGTVGVCVNDDFETANINGWTASTGYNPFNLSFWTADDGTECCNDIGQKTCGIDCQLDQYYDNVQAAWVAAHHTIVTKGSDPDIPALQRVHPDGGDYSIRLGNAENGGEADRMAYSFTVDPLAPNFEYNFAFVMNEPGHRTSEQPFFEAAAYDANGILIPCTRLKFAAGLDGGWIPGGQDANGRPLTYRDWGTYFMDLSDHVNEDVTVIFTAYDCAQGAHYGYAYLEASCGPLAVSKTVAAQTCIGTEITLNAPDIPAGYSYLWETGETTQQIQVTPSSDTTLYNLQIIPPLGCPVEIVDSVILVPENFSLVDAVSLSTPGTKLVTEACGAAIFTFERLDSSIEQTLRISIQGTATNDVDYGYLVGNDTLPVPDSIVLAVGQAIGQIAIVAHPDHDVESTEYIIMEIESIGECSGDTITIRDSILLLDVVPPDFTFIAPTPIYCAEGNTTVVDFSAFSTGVNDVFIDYGHNSATEGFTKYRDEVINFSHEYDNGAIYDLRVIYEDSICKIRDTVDLQVNVPVVKNLELDVPDIENVDLCSNKSIQINGVLPTEPVLDSFYWVIPTVTDNFRDIEDPIINMPNASGEYTGYLIAVTSDSTYCKRVDSTELTITVKTAVPVDFNFTQPAPIPCSLDSTTNVEFKAYADGVYDVFIDFGTNRDTEGYTRFRNENILFNYDYSNDDIYQAKVIYKDSICEKLDTLLIDINVPQPLNLDLNVPDIENVDLCSNKSIQLDGILPVTPVLDSFYWHIPTVADNFVNIEDPIISMPSGSGTYTGYLIAVTSDPNYCKKTDSTAFVITVKNAIPVNFDFTDPAPIPCSLDSTTTVEFNSTVQGVYDVKIEYGHADSSDGFITFRDESINFSYDYPNGGSYDVSIYYMDSICEVLDTIEKKIIIPETKFLELNVPDLEDIDLCTNKSLQLDGVLPSEPALDSFYWRIDSIDNQYVNIEDPILDMPVGSGEYTGYLVAVTSDTSYCIKKDSSEFKITIKEAVPVKFEFTDPEPVPCALDVTTNVEFRSDVDGVYDVKIDYGHNNDSDGFDRYRNEEVLFSYDYPNGGTYDVSIYYSDSICEKLDTIEKTIIIPEAKNLALNVPDIENVDLCLNKSIELEGILPNEPELDSFYWYIPTMTDHFVNDTTPTITMPDSANTYIGYLIATTSDTSYCIKTDSSEFTIEVKQYVPVDFDLTIPTPVACALGTTTTVDFKADIDGVYDVKIEYGHDNNQWGSNRLRNEAISESYDYPNGAVYEAIVAYKDSICEVEKVDTLEINIPEAKYLVLTIPPIAPIDGCGIPFTTTVQAQVDTNIVDGTCWLDASYNCIVSDELTPELTFNHIGDSTIYFIAWTNDTSYCIKSDTVSVEITTVPFPVFTADVQFPEIEPCKEEQDFIVDIKLDGTIKPDTVHWNFAGLLDTVTVNVNEFSYEFQKEGIYPIEILMEDPNGCRDLTFRDTAVYKITKSLTLGVKVNDYIKGCSPFLASFEADTTGDITDFFWDFNIDDAILDSVRVLDTTHSYLKEGTYQAIFTAITDNELYCIKKETDTVQIDIVKPTDITFSISTIEPEPCKPESIEKYEVNIDPSTSRPVESITWDMGDTNGFDTLVPFTHIYTSPGTYTITATAFDTVCQVFVNDYHTFTYQRGAILKDLIVPNIFTPNGDNFNEEFDIEFLQQQNVPGADKFYSYDITFFNRWGSEVFQGHKNFNSQELWDGKHEGEDVSAGVYFYILHFKATCTEEGEQVIDRQGHVTIVR